MATAVSPIKIDAETDQLVSHAAHFLCRSKKDVVDAAVREYIDVHRDEINAAVRSALSQLDGTRAGRVALLAGMTKEELAEYGGIDEG
jgi:predicted transcriptional regulator